MIEYTLLAKLAALAGSSTLIVPFCPPTDRMTFCPRACSVAMSLVNCCCVYPPRSDASVGSRPNETCPGVEVALPKATATRL